MRAQVPADSPIVPAQTVVVEGAPVGRGDSGNTRVAIGTDLPTGAEAWEQLAPSVPNLGVETAGPSSFGAIYGLRGLSNTPYFSDPAVTLYFDDIPLGGSFSYPTDLFGFSSASVFRGPQPTAFGRAGDGGVIVLSPSDALGEGEFRLGMGDFGFRSAALLAGAWQGASGDASVAVSFAERDGFIENTQIGEKVDDLRALEVFAKESLHPTPASEVTLELLGDRHRDGAAPLVPLGGPLFTVGRSHEGETDTEMLGAALKGSLSTPLGRVTSTTSYTSWRLNPYEDWLVLPPPLNSFLTQSQEAWNEELRIASAPQMGLSWDAGAWLSEGTTTGATDRSLFGTIPIEVSDYGYTKHEAALFGDVVLTPTPSWRISVGARGERTQKTYHQDEQVPTAGLHLHFVRVDDVFLPEVRATYTASATTSADAAVSFGSRPGGFAAYTDNPALIPFAAERTAAFEAGLHGAFANRRLVLDVRAFDYEITKYQIERSFSPTDYFVATAPRARSIGAELEATWKPSARWSIGGDAGLDDVTLLDFHDPLTGTGYDGDRAPYAPAFTAGVSATYRSVGGWFAAGSASAVGKTFYTESEDPAYAQHAYAVLGARIGFEAKRWRMEVRIENASDKGYYTLIIPGVASAAPGDPRTFGTELAAKF
jgi:iron complex outermembrane receptor protein